MIKISIKKKSAVEYTKQGKKNISTAYNAVFGKSTFPPPSDTNVFQVNKDMSLGESFFLWKGTKYEYSGVQTLSCSNSVFSFNYVVRTYDAYFEFIHEKIPSRVDVSSGGFLIKGKTTKKIAFAIPYIQKFTFHSRVQHYLKTLNDDGKIVIKDVENKKNVTLFLDGTIEQKGKTLSLETVFSNKTYLFGTHTSGSNHDRGEPDRIVLAYDKKVLLPSYISMSFGENRKFFTTKPRIDFTPESDFDVICAILKWSGTQNTTK